MGGSVCWQRGWFEVQDEGSQLVAEATGARPGQTCIDVCAGRGGKALALAAMTTSEQAAGIVVAHDVDPLSMRSLGPRANKAGLSKQLRMVCSEQEGVVGGRGGDVASLNDSKSVTAPKGDSAFDVQAVKT